MYMPNNGARPRKKVSEKSITNTTEQRSQRTVPNSLLQVLVPLWEHQQGACGSCRKAFTNRNTPRIDHDHDTGLVRGLLCHTCNIREGKGSPSLRPYIANPPTRQIGLQITYTDVLRLLKNETRMISIPGDLYEQLQDYADRIGQPIAPLVRDAIVQRIAD